MKRQEVKNLIRQAEQGYAWPGSYQLTAIMKDGGVLCPECVKENRGRIYLETLDRHGDKSWSIEAVEIHWEGPAIICDNCSGEIESAYGNQEEENHE
jgi:hypothetical protein